MFQKFYIICFLELISYSVYESIICQKSGCISKTYKLFSSIANSPNNGVTTASLATNHVLVMNCSTYRYSKKTQIFYKNMQMQLSNLCMMSDEFQLVQQHWSMNNQHMLNLITLLLKLKTHEYQNSKLKKKN